jgi:membrane associated rhomboid family serine protease
MFIPIGDDNSMRRRIPWVAWVLVAINAYVWFLALERGESFLAAYATIPLEITSGIDLRSTKFASFGGHIEAIPQAPGPSPIYLTLITSMFLHGSWLHIIGNMVYLLIFGDQIEDRFGHIKFLLFYLAAGIGAGLAQVAVEPMSVLPCVGASGAIAGVLGAYLILHPHNHVQVLVFHSVVRLPAFLVLGFWGLMQIGGHLGAPGEHGGVAYMAHIGGFVVGVIVGILTRATSPARYRYR